MKLFQKQQEYSQFFAAFMKSSLNFQHIYKKKLPLIGNVFPQLRTLKIVVR